VWKINKRFVVEKFSFSMAIMIHQWFSVLLLLSGTGHSPAKETAVLKHPFYVSVTEIEHNAKEKQLEVSCKMFLDDTEKTLNKIHKQPVELTNPKNPQLAQQQVFDYMKAHLKIKVDGKPVVLEFVGYEIEGASIWSYYQVSNIASLKKAEVNTTIFYETYPTQISIVHCTFGGTKKSNRVTNPEALSVFDF
jgi:hypothetical protein